MKEKIIKLKELAFSGTAKDTIILFGGNLGSAFWGFVFTLLVARSLSVADFGIFSAVLNLVVILASLTDIGISSGSVNFVAKYNAENDQKKVNEYIKASFVTRLILVLSVSAIVVVFAPFIATRFLATQDPKMAIWAAVVPVFWFFCLFFPYILQAKRKFLQSTIFDNAFYLGRLLFAAFFFMSGTLTMDNAFWGFGAGFLVSLALGFWFIKTDFLSAKPNAQEYKNLLKFSGWVGVNRIVSSVSGRLDIQMLASMAGAVATGLYSIPSRLASFIIVLSGSFSSVLATRLAAFNDRDKEKAYIVKSTLALIPITAGIVLWIIIAEPFITILFGQKYLPAVPIFQALAASQIPFLFTVPAVSAIIYSMKKTIHIGLLSFFQLAGIFALNYYLIPKYGPFGPTMTFGITNMLLAAYVWWVVIKHYWINK